MPYNTPAQHGTVNTPSPYTPDEFEREALSTMAYEKGQWDDAAVFVTDNEQYMMRNVINQARRYYSGVFKNPFDEITGEKKTWVPLTRWSVDSVVKSIDLDTKDILIQPGNPHAVDIAPVIRASILNLFKEIRFGDLLNDLTTVMARDGTVVIKSLIQRDENTGKKKIVSYIVNLLNLWVDPSALSMADTPVIERSIHSQQEISMYKDIWSNFDSIAYSENVSRQYDLINYANGGKLPEAAIWERWGKIKKSWLTKDAKDEDTWLEGHMVASGINGPEVLHLTRKNPRKDGKKPYEECWYHKESGRWYGRGVPETLFDLQEYSNMIVNTRKANNMVLQNGIFLIRKGSGITPDMLSAITAGGGLPVSNIQNDIKQLQTQDYRQSSYADEDRAYMMADRASGSYDINRGEVGRASASATATLTRDRNIRDTFVLVQENIGFFIERLIKDHYIPLLKETLRDDDLIKITGDADFLSFIDDRILTNRRNKFIQDHIGNTGFYPEFEDIDEFMNIHSASLKNMGKQRFVKYFNTMFDENVDVEIHVTDEKFNRVVAAQQIRDTIIAYSRLPVASKLNVDALMGELFNIIGLKGEFFLEKPQVPTLASDIAQTGRQMKELPGGIPSEMSAQLAGAGMQQGPQIPGGGV